MYSYYYACHLYLITARYAFSNEKKSLVKATKGIFIYPWAEFAMGRVCHGPGLLWAEFVMGRDVPEPNSGVSRFGPIGAGRFGPISKVDRFGPILGVNRFGLIYLFGENR